MDYPTYRVKSTNFPDEMCELELKSYFVFSDCYHADYDYIDVGEGRFKMDKDTVEILRARFYDRVTARRKVSASIGDIVLSPEHLQDDMEFDISEEDIEYTVFSARELLAGLKK
jgi:hypothetical protein